MVIHGGIDGYSRLVVYLRCNNNNRASTVANDFVKATTKYFIPSRVCSDYGRENIDVAKCMLTQRGFKVVSSEFYFHKPITVHIELYLFYRFIHFLLYIGQY